jgi:hypothetical protein
MQSMVRSVRGGAMDTRSRLLVALGLWACVPSCGVDGQTVAVAKESNIVFVGTVVRVGAASFTGVPTSPRTLIVHVDDVLDKPVAVRLSVGDSVTVEARTDTAWRAGTRATFYTRGWIFGRGLAVQEVGHESMPAQMSAADLARHRGAFLQLRQQVTDSALQARIRAADMIIVGRVESIRAPTQMAQPRRRITEHDPDWREAVFVVESMLKGGSSPRVVVRFPASLDIAWHGLPKFSAGQEGTFLLHRDTLSGTPRAVLGGQPVTAYTVVTSADVLSRADAQRVRALVAP